LKKNATARQVRDVANITFKTACMNRCTDCNIAQTSESWSV